jgi:hypothetical protein
MERWIRLALYFGSWACLAILTTLLSILNTDWSETHIIGGIVMVLMLAVLQGFVLEYPIQTIFCIIFGGHTRNIKTADGSHLTLILNYNLLATSNIKDFISIYIKLLTFVSFPHIAVCFKEMECM